MLLHTKSFFFHPATVLGYASWLGKKNLAVLVFFSSSFIDINFKEKRENLFIFNPFSKTVIGMYIPI